LDDVKVYTDGASRGNPGAAAAAFVVYWPDGRVDHMGLYLGRTTNNVAEYVALVAALRYILKRGVESFALFSDSELLIRQIKGRYAVRSARLKRLHEEAMSLLSRFDSYCVAYVPREENFEADRWANETLDVAKAAMTAF